MYRAVIFDLDGTLLDTLDDLTKAVNDSLALHHLPLRSRQEIRDFVGNGVARLISRAVPEGTADRLTTAVLSDFKEFYTRCYRDRTRPYDGIPSLLEELRRRGIRTGIVSNKFDAAVKDLSSHYFPSLIEVAVGEREAEGIRKKPAPDTLLLAMAQLEVLPRETLYVGDADTDILTARAAEVDCISVTWGFRDKEFLLSHGARTLIHHPQDILSLL